jgi:hypothetical protein
MPNDTESDPAFVSMNILLDQLSSEYKILQDKIDKIGAFKFTIRGWSVTIVVASCIGATTAHLPSPFLLLGLIVFVLLFFRMEQIQTGYRNTFSRRCAEIERWIWRLLREQGARAHGMVPKIAHELADQSRVPRAWNRPVLRPLAKMWRTDDEFWFYAALILAILALTIWLVHHPIVPERSDPIENIQYNVPSVGPASPASPGAKTEYRKETGPHGPSKKTTSSKP